MSGVLVICRANVCRSPLAAELLRREPVVSALGVTSAGSHAAGGQPRCELSARIGAASRDGSTAEPADVASRRLDRGMLADAELVVTAEESQRSAAARLLPAARSRMFTLREALALGEVLLERDQRFDDLPSLVQALDAARGIGAVAAVRPRLLGKPVPPNDLPDGHGLRPARHRRALEDVAVVASGLGDVLRRLLASR